MGLVSTWLNGIGLRSVVPTFEAAGIVSPTHLADLDVTYFESLGVTDPDDRRKLFYLVQRIKMAVKDERSGSKGYGRCSNGRDGSSISVEESVDAAISENFVTENDDKAGQEYDSNTVPKLSEDVVREEKSKLAPRRSKRIRKLAKKQKQKNDDTKENNNSEVEIETPVLPATTRTSSASRNQTIDACRSSLKEEEEKFSSSPPSKQKSVKESSSKLAKCKIKYEDRHQVSSKLNPLSSKIAIPFSACAFNQQNGHDPDKNNLQEYTNSSSRVQTSQKIDLPQLTQNKSSIRRPHESKLPGSKRIDERLTEASSLYIESQSPVVEPTSSSVLNDDIEEFQSSRYDISKQKRRITLSANIDSLENHFQPHISELTLAKNNNHKNITVIGENDENPDITTNNNYNASQSRSLPKLTTNRLSKSMSASDSVLLQQYQRGHQKNFSSSSSSAPIITQSTNEIAESWTTQIDYLREDNETEHNLFRDLAETENQYHEYYDMRIKVIIRKRPLSKAEARLTGGIDIIHSLDYGSYGRILAYQPKTRVDLAKEVETVPFAFDNVFDESSTNIGIYERSLRNLVEPFFNGQWATVFAYGQTGSGKTYTMMGSNIKEIGAGTGTNEGFYYFAAVDIFKMIEMPEHCHLKVHISLFEIYSGKLFDLLNGRTQIKCLEDSKGKVCFPGLTEHPVHAPEHVMQLIEEGAVNRSTGTTSRNADSSRSHAVLQIKLMKNSGRKKNAEHGRFSFIDLAGSERGADTSNASSATRREGAEINTSLLALKEVIRALAAGGSMTHIPFRGSKLTQVLKDSFIGHNSRCCMVACISPDIGNCEQTLNTLRYADRVKERNPESGVLSTSCQQPTKIKSIQPFKVCAKRPLQQRQSIDQDSRIEQFKDQDTKYVVDELRPVGIRAKSASEAEPLNISKAKMPYKINVTNKQKAGQALVSNHRSVMTRWLTMVKNEMNSVNQVDAERDRIDNYILELQNLQRTQLDFISELRGSLQKFVSASEGRSQISGGQDDDDSFEDLRD